MKSLGFLICAEGFQHHCYSARIPSGPIETGAFLFLAFVCVSCDAFEWIIQTFRYMLSTSSVEGGALMSRALIHYDAGTLHTFVIL